MLQKYKKAVNTPFTTFVSAHYLIFFHDFFSTQPTKRNIYLFLLTTFKKKA